MFFNLQDSWAKVSANGVTLQVENDLQYDKSLLQ